MTCIVGLVSGGKVYVGGDSASVANSDMRISAVPKVFRRGPFVIGYTSSWRMGQILEHHVAYEDMPVPKLGDSLQEFMVRVFIEEVRKALKEYGYSKVENNEETGGHFLVGCYGHLYHIAGDYQVMENTDEMDACGAGEEYALGVLYTTKDSQLTPYRRIDLALEAAAKFSSAVAPPFRIEAVE